MGSDRRLAPLDEHHPENAALLAWLTRTGRREPIARPSSVVDPYQECGAHPDVVERVWDQLGRALPRATRALVHGTPALVHERRGLVLALALGTQYALRLPEAALEEAQRQGLTSVHVYGTTRERLDLTSFGPTWRFGHWASLEPTWTTTLHEELESRRTA